MPPGLSPAGPTPICLAPATTGLTLTQRGKERDQDPVLTGRGQDSQLECFRHR